MVVTLGHSPSLPAMRLQGVVGTKFSHILNATCALNVRPEKIALLAVF